MSHRLQQRIQRVFLFLSVLFSRTLSFLPPKPSFSVETNISVLKNNRRPRNSIEWPKLGLSSQHTDWGVFRHEKNPIFPDDVESITIAIWEAITATLYARERLDPNIIHNARSRTLYKNVPIRRDVDRGRIGIEIDGASHLFRSNGMTNVKAIRHISLQLGAQLTKGPWEGYEKPEEEFTRPVAIYFNTIKQTLIACEELANVKRASKSVSTTSFDNIIVQTLGQDPEIPQKMKESRKRSKKGVQEGKVDPKRGIIVIVQPTDFNSEFNPPGPAVDSVSHLQQLVARAAVENLPVVIISPRFLAHQCFGSNNRDQSGFQRSSVYGGSEPPLGPTPWILRDFFPPVFAWIGCAVSLSRDEVRQSNNDSDFFFFSRVSMMQSILNEGHSWQLFGVKEYNHKQTHQYLASTNTAAGRPTIAIVKSIFDEWSS